MLVNGIKVIFGGVAFAAPVEVAQEWLKILEGLGIMNIDTAEAYGPSEEVLGNVNATSTFILDTKILGGLGPRPSTKDVVVESGTNSLKKLKTDTVDVFYLHAPDRRVSWKDTLSGLNELYQQGAFKRLGLSQFLGPEIEEIIQVAKENNFVVPSVYQGNYNAVARRAEEEIFPVLRKHNISFYAYSPIAGGFLSKSKADLADPDGRFGERNPFPQAGFISALDAWGQIAKDEGVSRAALAYRWIFYHSRLQGDHGDGVILGARKEEQLKETVEAIKRGPLSDSAVKKADEIWQSVKADAWLDNFELSRTTQF
ncbi:aflatoxin B1 aldehyde reductase member 3 protein [Rutstroemia sp. NJR-2017a WRK4]|nr:aflatoxin B1 aldehyde reductase member 3 protein [Rutstroemia sp. NJR-2017a WRK4]